MAEKKPEQQEEFFKPEELFRPIDEICATAPPLEPLWGYFLFKKCLTSIVGDPGVCKSTLGYGLGFNLSLGKPFLDIAAEEPVKVLYLDFESADSLVKSRKTLITEEKTPNFIVYNIVDYYLPQIAEVLVKFCNEQGINLIIVDNQSMAFNTRDENDNAEAVKQMRFVRAIAIATNTAVIIFHHTSKANLPGTRKGTGAFARARLADVCINLETPDEDNKDIVQLETVKNRLVDEKVLWYLKKEKGQFIPVDPPLGVSGQSTTTVLYKAQTTLLEIIDGNQEFKFGELVAQMEEKGFSDNWTDHAVRRLLQQNRIWRPRYGFYARR